MVKNGLWGDLVWKNTGRGVVWVEKRCYRLGTLDLQDLCFFFSSMSLNCSFLLADPINFFFFVFWFSLLSLSVSYINNKIIDNKMTYLSSEKREKKLSAKRSFIGPLLVFRFYYFWDDLTNQYLQKSWNLSGSKIFIEVCLCM